MASESIVITGAARTPLGSFQGRLKSVPAPQLGAAAIKAALARAGVGSEAPDEVLMGCVLPAGLGQAPARQASIAAGIPNTTGCTTINKVCGSGMKAAMLGHDAILAGSARVVVAGGMESMSNAPYLLAKARAGYRMGHWPIYDHMFLDGLEDAYDRGALMGKFAEETAEKFQFTRCAGRIRHSVSYARQTGNRGRNVCARDRPRHGRRRRNHDRRIAHARRSGENPQVETRLPLARHRDRCKFELYLGLLDRSRADLRK